MQSLLGELKTARARADSAEQFSASVRAIEAKARVSGLLTQKIEITNVTEEFDDAKSIEDIAAVLANAMAKDKGYQLTGCWLNRSKPSTSISPDVPPSLSSQF